MPEIFAFATALFAAGSLTPAARQLALRLGVVDRPGARKLHLNPVPLLGGLAIYTAVVLAAIFAVDGGLRSEVLAILAAATLLAAVGFLDDRGWLHHQVKLFVAMPLAGLILVAAGVRAHVASAVLSNPFGYSLDMGLTLLWVVGITAAFSILDHMDGLCAGIAATAAAFFLVFALIEEQVLVGTLAAAILGASLGFLRWNFNPAKIFMGDGGAMFLGFMLATLGLKLRIADLSPVTAWMIPILILGIPIFDTTLITVSRLRRGLIPFSSPGKDHVAHRLVNLGLGQRAAVLSLYGAGFCFGLLAILISRLSLFKSALLAVAIGLAAIFAILALENVPYERQNRKA